MKTEVASYVPLAAELVNFFFFFVGLPVADLESLFFNLIVDGFVKWITYTHNINPLLTPKIYVQYTKDIKYNIGQISKS